MVRDTTAFLVLHYVLLIGIIFLLIGILEVMMEGFPLWIGLIVAVAVGIIYPRVVVSMGYAPSRWES